MKIKTVNRTIHTKTHKSKNAYRVKIGMRNYYDQLVVNISHENLGFIGTYIFEGDQISNFESIHFKAEILNDKVYIHWVQSLEFKIA